MWTAFFVTKQYTRPSHPRLSAELQNTRAWMGTSSLCTGKVCGRIKGGSFQGIAFVTAVTVARTALCVCC